MSAASQASSREHATPSEAAVARASAAADRALREYVWRELAAFSDHYGKSFPGAGLDPRRLGGIAELRSLPPVTRGMLVGNEEDFRLRPTPASLREHWGFARKLGLVTGGRRAWRNLLAAYSTVLELEDSGAPPLRIATTGSDLERMAGDGARRLTELGLGPGAALVADDAPPASLTHWWITLSAVRAACRLVPGAGDALHACARSGARALWASVEQARALARRAREEVSSLDSLALVLAHGPGLDDETRRELADGFADSGATVLVAGVYVSTATRTVLVETPSDPAAADPGAGYPVSLDRLAVEVIDPDSGAPLSAKMPGELLLTPLDGRGTAVIRYRTGDVLGEGFQWRTCPFTGGARPYLSRPVEARAPSPTPTRT